MRTIPVIIVALPFFVLINFAFRMFNQSPVVGVDTWSEAALSAVNAYRKLPVAPQIVLMGSSIMRSPFWCADNIHFTNTPQFKTYHRARWFEQKCKALGVDTLNVYNLAMDGACVSDVYLTARRLFKSVNPQVIIYGISPGAFASTLLIDPTSTPAFHLLFGFDDLFELDSIFSTNLIECTRLWEEQLVPLCASRRILQERLEKLIHNNMVSASSGDRPAYSDGIKVPMRERLNIFENWREDNKRLINQEKCFRLFLEELKAQKRRVLIVNMPMSPTCNDTETLFYKNYINLLERISEEKQVAFLDLRKERAIFTKDCFMDEMHMNAKGGEKFIAIVSNWFAHENQSM